MADKENLFKHPEEEKKSEPVDLVGFFNSPEEEKAAIAKAEEARKRAEELLKDPDKANEPIDLVSFTEPNNGKDKEYLLLFSGFEKDTEKEVHDWLIAKGRRQAYEYIKMYMENEEIFYDLKQSKILVDVERFEEAKSQYDFMEWIIENDLMGVDEMYPHLDEYDYLDDEEEEE